MLENERSNRVKNTEKSNFQSVNFTLLYLYAALRQMED